MRDVHQPAHAKPGEEVSRLLPLSSTVTRPLKTVTAHYFPFTKKESARWRRKGKPILRKPCAIKTVSKLAGLETRQGTKPGEPASATAPHQGAGPEQGHMRSAGPGAQPQLPGGEARRRTRRLPRRGAQLMRLLSGPSPALLGRPLSGRRSAPQRPGTGEAVTPQLLRPARAGASRERAALGVRVSERPGPWGPERGGRPRRAGCGAVCHRGPWPPARLGGGGARALHLRGPAALGSSCSGCKAPRMLLSSGGLFARGAF